MRHLNILRRLQHCHAGSLYGHVPAQCHKVQWHYRHWQHRSPDRLAQYGQIYLVYFHLYQIFFKRHLHPHGWRIIHAVRGGFCIHRSGQLGMHGNRLRGIFHFGSGWRRMHINDARWLCGERKLHLRSIGRGRVGCLSNIDCNFFRPDLLDEWPGELHFVHRLKTVNIHSPFNRVISLQRTTCRILRPNSKSRHARPGNIHPQGAA